MVEKKIISINSTEHIEKKLDRKTLDKFAEILTNNLYDRFWCKMHGIDYVNPDIKKAKIETYKEMKYFGYL